MKHFLSNLFGRRSVRPTPARRPARFRPGLESLEGRDLMSVTLAGGVLTIQGDATSEKVSVSLNTHGTASVYDDTVEVTRYSGAPATLGADSFYPFVETASFARYQKVSGVYQAKVSRIVFNAGNGTNEFTNGTSLASQAYGGSGKDRFTGGSGKDDFYGYGGDDQLLGGGGDDTLDGGSGNDHLDGAGGNDKLVSGSGTNTLSDGTGSDRIDFSLNAVGVHYTTQGGNDTLIGTAYDDVLTGGTGNDRLEGLGGNDRLFGKGGADVLYGGAGNDWLEAGSAGETADGGSGYDFNAHRWALDGARGTDIRQTGVGDCVFLSGLSGAAYQGIDLASRITYLGNYTYQVKLFNADTGAAWYENVHFDGTYLYSGTFGLLPEFSWYGTGSGDLLDPRPAAEGEFWTVLSQRAYLGMMNTIGEDFKDPAYAMFAVTARPVITGDWDDPGLLHNALAAKMVITAGDADDTALVHAHHSYTVVAVDFNAASGNWEVTLRNPWGRDGGPVPWGDPNDGILKMTWQDFQGYHDFDRISIS